MNWPLLKFKICALINTVNRMKRQAQGWEKIFEKHVSDKELVAKIEKKMHLKLNNNKSTNSF